MIFCKLFLYLLDFLHVIIHNEGCYLACFFSPELHAQREETVKRWRVGGRVLEVVVGGNNDTALTTVMKNCSVWLKRTTLRNRKK